MNPKENLIKVSDYSELLDLLPEIRNLADQERNGLGFLPVSAFEDAIQRGRLLAFVDGANQSNIFVGYILHSGEFPNAKVQQIAVVESHRKLGIGSVILNSLVSDLENLGFTLLRADVADDLNVALKFYAKNGFTPILAKAGGSSRKRRIIVHRRELDANNLLSPKENNGIDLGIPRRSAPSIPLYSLDLNVFFDLVKKREYAPVARDIFSAALNHEIRLAVAKEFVAELKRTSKNVHDDPVYQLALALPKLPSVDPTKLSLLSDKIHETVFVEERDKPDFSEQALSDASHIAHATLAGVSGFVTRDTTLLRARSSLFQEFSIDVVAVDELQRILPLKSVPKSAETLRGKGFSVSEIAQRDLSKYLDDNLSIGSLDQDYASTADQEITSWRRCIKVNNEIVGIAVLLKPRVANQEYKLLIHCREEIMNAELFSDFLIDLALREASRKAVSIVNLEQLPKQPTLMGLSRAKGFTKPRNKTYLDKIVVGRPITKRSWPAISDETRRGTGLRLPRQMPRSNKSIEIENYSGRKYSLSRNQFETLIGPTVIAWENKSGVLIPIQPVYSQQLLTAGSPPSLLPKKDAEFHSKRSYLGNHRVSSIMEPDAPIFFYESMSKGNGAGAVIAVARIVDAVIYPVNEISRESLQRLVVENVRDISKAKEVLITTFENIFVVPKPVTFKALKEMKAVDGANLVTARSIDWKIVNRLLDAGWGNV